MSGWYESRHYKGAMRSPRTRNIIASVLGVLAVLLLVVGTVAVWARVTVTSSERVADLAVDAFDEAEVQAALSDYLTNLVFSAVDVDAALGCGAARSAPEPRAVARRRRSDRSSIEVWPCCWRNARPRRCSGGSPSGRTVPRCGCCRVTACSTGSR